MNWLMLIAGRAVWFFPTLLGLLSIVFVLSRVVPVDPAILIAGENATAEQIQHIRERFGLEKPLPIQFINYLHDIARGNFGVSFYTQQPILHDLAVRLPATLELTLAATLLSIVIGVPLGILCGLHRNSWIDHALRVATISSLAIASFWMAMEFQYIFSMQLHWLPLTGRISGFPPEPITGFMIIDTMIMGDGEALASTLRHMILPTLTLALPSAATMARFTRNGVIGVINSPSIIYQTAMGLPRQVIIWKYVLRMATIGTVTQIGLNFGVLMTGALVVEAIFDWPGLGSYAIHSILQSDYNAVMGYTLCTGAMFIVLNLLVDMLHAAIDPRGSA